MRPLGYCANVHPGAHLADVIAGVHRFAGPVRRELGLAQMGLGLWLNRASLTELQHTGLGPLRDALEAEGLFVFTMNGFPYGAFQEGVVKHAVYRPDLATDERRTYLLELAEVLSALAPADLDERTISTLPLGHRNEMSEERTRESAAQLTRLIEDLARLRDRTGRAVRLCLEPEPGCVLETTEDAARFFADVLPAAGASRDLVDAHLGLSYDTCHQAVAFEDPRASWQTLADAGVRVGKMQLSSALVVPDPSAAANRAALASFDDGRFLHQVRCRTQSGVQGVDDLSDAAALPSNSEWRVHFHVPVHRELVGGLGTTRNFLREALRLATASSPAPHLEVETYTWSVLPEAERAKDEEGLVHGLAAELRFILEELMSASSPLVVINVVGLTPGLVGPDTPHLAALARDGFMAPITPVLPAVTCTAQATMLTGTLPRAHGIVGNGWYFRDLAEVFFWRQSNTLVAGEKVWETARRARPGFRVAKMFWWYNMYSSADLSVTPRPMYPADGRKIPALYSHPASLETELVTELGPFPFFNFWGPTADLRSSDWIAKASARVFAQHRPDLTLVYLPHLDYNFQRLGPSDPRVKEDVRAVDRVAGQLIEAVRAGGAEVVVVSEYGLEDVQGVVHLNRHLREAGLLFVRDTLGWDMLDAGASKAFAVADHQVAHVYVRDPADLTPVRDLVSRLPGVERVLDADGKREAGLDHERAGELVAVAAPGYWFSYYYWLDDARAPDFAPTVDIHRKPGYDPVELFVDPERPLVKGRVAWNLAKKKLGFRYLMDVIPLRAELVKGTHGRVTTRDADGPVLIASNRRGAADRIAMPGVRDFLLKQLLEAR